MEKVAIIGLGLIGTSIGLGLRKWAAADKGGPGGAAITKYVAPRALWWFRWAAVATWVTGAYFLLFGYGNPISFHKAFLLQPGFVTIGVGAWLGTIMLLNVWGLIWPNQPLTRKRPRRARSRCTPHGSISFCPCPC